MLAVETLQTGFTMKAASQIIGVHEKTVYAFAKQGRIETYTGVDGRMMVTREELYHFIRNQN